MPRLPTSLATCCIYVSTDDDPKRDQLRSRVREAVSQSLRHRRPKPEPATAAPDAAVLELEREMVRQ